MAKSRKSHRNLTNRIHKRNRSRAAITLCSVVATLFAVLAICGRISQRSSTSSIYYAQGELPFGIAGVMHSVDGLSDQGYGATAPAQPEALSPRPARERIPYFNVTSSMQSRIVEYTGRAKSLSKTSSLMSDDDYEILCKIVEAEAGTEDLVGRILVANVIMNRVKNSDFPNSVSEVVFQYDNDVPQFSPVADGRIYDVDVCGLTLEAVRLALEGADYSKGALFFIQKDTAEYDGIAWFEESLAFLFQHGAHRFYTYPELT